MVSGWNCLNRPLHFSRGDIVFEYRILLLEVLQVFVHYLAVLYNN